MGIITISRGSYSRGAEIAQKLADKLGYTCVSREMLLEYSQKFNIPEIKLMNATRETPSDFDYLKGTKVQYLSFIREAFLKSIEKDDVVYHGFAGHFFSKEIPNILKVRILANIDYRINVLMHRENISEDKARKLLHQIDRERKQWSLYLHGIDTNATELYDIVLHIDNLNVDDAVEFVYILAKSPCFQTTFETKKKLKDMLVAARAYSKSNVKK
ncbi:MAG: cytidylate kinase-like family protein [Ignavibacteria bacterium]|jgi:cytidylate kinase